jgi:hypothetical protein
MIGAENELYDFWIVFSTFFKLCNKTFLKVVSLKKYHSAIKKKLYLGYIDDEVYILDTRKFLLHLYSKCRNC